MEDQKTVLIVGISSFVGSNLANFLKRYFRVVGTYHNSEVNIDGILTIPCDVLNRDAIQIVLYNFRPQITIYAAGLSSVENSQREDKYADALNTAGLFNVAAYTERYKSRLIYLSSCFVFNCSSRFHLEKDSPDPSTAFGKTKVSAEFFMQKSLLNYLIFRCCSFYGRAINFRSWNLFEVIQRNLEKGHGINLDGQIKIGFLDINYLGMLIKLAIDKNISNRLFHVSSKDYLTAFEFGRLYAKIFKKNIDLIRKSNWYFPENFQDLDPEQISYKIDINAIENELDIVMPTIEESLTYSYYSLGGDQLSEKKDEEDRVKGGNKIIQFI